MAKTYDEVVKLWQEKVDYDKARNVLDPTDFYCWDSIAFGFGLAHGLEGEVLDEFVVNSNELAFGD